MFIVSNNKDIKHFFLFVMATFKLLNDNNALLCLQQTTAKPKNYSLQRQELVQQLPPPAQSANPIGQTTNAPQAAVESYVARVIMSSGGAQSTEE